MSNKEAKDLLNAAKAANPSLSNITFRPWVYLNFLLPFYLINTQ
jgi:hypothetical protein